jgi:hypothetical protein
MTSMECAVGRAAVSLLPGQAALSVRWKELELSWTAVLWSLLDGVRPEIHLAGLAGIFSRCPPMSATNSSFPPRASTYVASASRVATSPRSIYDTHLGLTPMISASPAWVKPSRFRSSAR